MEEGAQRSKYSKHRKSEQGIDKVRQKGKQNGQKEKQNASQKRRRETVRDKTRKATKEGNVAMTDRYQEDRNQQRQK